MSTVLVTGATGFIGRRLVPALIDAGHEVRAMTRHPETYVGPGEAVGADVMDADSLKAALAGAEVAVYLVHSLDDPDFERKDADAARNFSAAAAAAGLRQIVYMGGLGDDDQNLSAHLRSRREVEALLGTDGVPLTVLRAAIVVEDVIRYLVGVVDEEQARGRVFEIGGTEELTYLEMMQVAAQAMNGRTIPIVGVPLLTPRLSSYWLALVTDVDATTGRNLVDSMSTEVVVRDTSIRDVVPGDPLSYAESVRRALAERAAAASSSGEEKR